MRKALGLSFLVAFSRRPSKGRPTRGRQGQSRRGLCRLPRPERRQRQRTIPNLAGQRAAYIESQLKAFKDGIRKNPSPANPTAIMNAMASQLSPAQMTDVAAYFASLPGAQPGAAKSAQLPNVAKTHLTFPENYKASFVKYHTINFPATKQVRYYYANRASVDAAKAGNFAQPDSSYLLAEVYAAKLDADGKPITGPDGFYVADKPLLYTAMATGTGSGRRHPPSRCATATGTTPSSPSTSSTGPSTRPSASPATSRSTAEAASSP